MAERLKYYVIVLDGIDKTGKDLIAKYVFELSGKRYITIARGIMSMIAYSKLFCRDFEYNLEAEKLAPVVNVLLTVDKRDWEIRCKINDEPNIDYDMHSKAFTDASVQLLQAGILVRKYNTSDMTPFNIAKAIVSFVHTLNGVDTSQL